MGIDNILGEKELDKVLQELKKNYGKEIIHTGKEMENITVARWDIESPNLSYVLGGGLPKGRIVEVYGVESGGKTAICTYMLKEVQKQGGRVAVIDAEHSYDLFYASTIGLDTDATYIISPESGEQALSVAESLAKSKQFDVILIDSVSALTPQAEIDGDMGASHMGLQARLMSQACRKLTSILANTGTTVIFINQIRMKIGCVDPETKIIWK